MTKTLALASAVFLSLIMNTSTVFAQAFPSRTVRFVAAEIGGSSDIIARLIAAHLSDIWGQPVIVDNRDPTTGGQMVAHSAPDGYTVLFGGTAAFIAPLFQTMPFDPIKDVVPVTMISNSPLLMMVPPTLPVQSVQDVIALAKAKPGQLNFGTAGAGSSGDLAGELLKSMAGIDIVGIHYKGSSRALTALLGGEVQMSFVTAPSVLPLVKSGSLKALAVTSAQPSATAPGVPTVASAGLAGYDVGSAIGVLVAPKTPENIINQLNQDILRVLDMPDVKEKLLSLGDDVVGSSPAEYGAAMRAVVARVGKLVQDEGLRVNK